MKTAVLTIVPPSGGNGTGWVDIDVSATALSPLSVGDPLIINPTDKSMNLNSAGLMVAFVSAPDVVSVGVKLLNATVDVIVATP